MKQLRVIPVMVVLCLLILALALVSLFQQLTHPDKGNFEIYLGDYRHVIATVDVGEITDQVVEDNLYAMQTEAATKETVTDGAKKGDVVTIHYSGVLQGETETIFSGSDEPYVIGAEKQNQFAVHGLDSHLLGVKAGDAVHATLMVQENYHVSDFVGKQVDFSITVQSVERIIVPERTDAFAQSQGFDNVAAMEQSMRDQLEVIQAAANDMAIRNGVWTQVVNNATVLDPKTAEVEELKNNMLTQIRQEADATGLDLLGYATFMYQFDGETEEEMDAWAANVVWKNKKEQMVQDAICRKEGIVLTDSEYQQKVNQAIDQNKQAGFEEYNKQTLIDDLGVINEEGLKQHFLWIKVTDRLLETATIIKN